jgi:non-ribosomal peptide synthetase component F
MAVDGWSTGVLLDELGQLYLAHDQHRPVDLLEPECRFGDYAVWLQELIESGELHPELDYWKDRLAGMPPLELTRTRKRPCTLKRKTGLVECRLPRELVPALKRLGNKYNASFFATLMAAFQVWIYRHTGQGDFGIGFPVTGRHRPEIGGLVGYLVHVLVLRAGLDPSHTFAEVLKLVRDDIIESLNNQTIPFDCVVKATHPQRTAGQNPLFQALFTVEPELPPSLQLGEAETTPIQELDLPAPFDIVMSVGRVHEGMSVKVKYDQNLFTAGETELMARRYVTLLENLVNDPDSPISQPSLLSDEERHLLLVKWNQTRSEYPRTRCIHQLFEGHVESDPEARAVVSEDTCLSYTQLNAKANRLARHLQEMGVAPEDVVGVRMPRSDGLLVSILAVFKAGGVYLPLDPDLPEARLRYMIGDSGAKAVITDDKGSLNCHQYGLPVCNVDEVEEQLLGYSIENLSIDLGPTCSAYAIYTSGSSGRPKGVLVGHQSAVNVLIFQCRMINVVPRDVLLAHMSIAFDASISELFMPLVFGASVFPVAQGASQDTDRLINVLEQNRVTLLHSTPDFWSLLLAGGWRIGTGLRAFCGGQASTTK